MKIGSPDTTEPQESSECLNTPWHTQSLYGSVVEDFLPQQRYGFKKRLRAEASRRLTKLVHKRVRGEIRQRAHFLAVRRERLRAQTLRSSSAAQRSTLRRTAWLPVSMSYDCSASTE